MIRKATILGVIFSLLACLRLASGQSPSLELQISIARAKSSPAGGATRSSPTRTVPPAVLDAESQPTPMESVVEGLQSLRLVSTDIYEDIGCGRDCRWGIIAAQRYGCKVIGIEIDPEAAAEAKRCVEQAGLSHLIRVEVGDATKITTDANKASAYLFESDLERLKPKIKNYDKFVTYAHQVPGLAMTHKSRGDIYIYDRPPAMVAKMIQPEFAVWKGQRYTRAKSGCNCGMCQSINSQLAPRMVMVPASTAAAQPQPAGRYVLMKKCVNGRCSMQRVWQAY